MISNGKTLYISYIRLTLKKPNALPHKKIRKLLEKLSFTFRLPGDAFAMLIMTRFTRTRRCSIFFTTTDNNMGSETSFKAVTPVGLNFLLCKRFHFRELNCEIILNKIKKEINLGN